MIDITKISENELRQDLQDSKDDIVNCEIALKNNIKTYSGGSVEERLKINQKCIDVITKELNRRVEVKKD